MGKFSKVCRKNVFALIFTKLHKSVVGMPKGIIFFAGPEGCLGARPVPVPIHCSFSRITLPFQFEFQLNPIPPLVHNKFSALIFFLTQILVPVGGKFVHQLKCHHFSPDSAFSDPKNFRRFDFLFFCGRSRVENIRVLMILNAKII